jgi:hypothetical protein
VALAALIANGVSWRGPVRDCLNDSSVADIVKQVAAWIGSSAKRVGQVSEHSVRVGATQDLLGLNLDLASVMQAAKWENTCMPMRYAEEILPTRPERRKARDETECRHSGSSQDLRSRSCALNRLVAVHASTITHLVRVPQLRFHLSVDGR